MSYQIFLGAAATLLVLLGFIPYFRELIRGRTKPHAFSWFLWGILNGVAFFASLAKGGGPGAWTLGLPAVLNFIIFGISLSRGEKRIVLIDRICLVAALLGIAAWVITTDPFLSVIIVTLVDFTAFVPTYRKSYVRPFEESINVYAITAVAYFMSLFALQSISVTTFLYPASLVVTDTAFVIMVLYRRRAK